MPSSDVAPQLPAENTDPEEPRHLRAELPTARLQRKATSLRMELERKEWVKIPVCWCCGTTLCWWFPLIAFIAAANVLEGCEQALGFYLRAASLACLLILPVVQTLIVAFAYFKVNMCFKFVEFLRDGLHAVTCAVLLVLTVWGWAVWARSSDARCYDGDAALAHYVNPRTLVLLLLCFLTIGFVAAGGCMCLVVTVALCGGPL